MTAALNRFRPALALAAAGFAYGAFQWGARPAPGLFGAVLWALAGLCLLFSAQPALGGIPEQAPRREAWEAAFVGLLILLAFGLRAWKLGSVPEFSVGYESVIAQSMRRLADSPYQAHDTARQDVNWPTIYHYQALLLTKLAGWSYSVMRYASVLWGGLGLLAFYFVTRRLTSPFAAAAATLLFAANHLHLVMSRRLYPAVPDCAIALLAFWACVEAGRRKSWLLYAAAGFLAGLGMHFYHSGRVVMALFPAWLILAALFYPGVRPGIKGLAAFAAGFMLCYLPLWLWNSSHPGTYWQWFDKISTTKGRPLAETIELFKVLIPVYAKMLFVPGAGDPFLEDALPKLPLLDPATAMLALSGFFLALWTCWRAGNAFMLLLFFAGLAAAMMGGHYVHPVPRRTIMALPAIYFFAALSLERLRQASAQLPRAAGPALAGLVALAAVWGAGSWTLRNYQGFAGYAPAARFFNTQLYHAAQKLWEYPNAKATYMRGLVANDMQTPFYAPKGRSAFIARGFEELIAVEPGKEQLLFLEPWQRPGIEWLRASYPGAKVEELRWPKPLDRGDPLARFFDPDSHLGMFAYAHLPVTESARLQGLLDLGGPGAGTPINPFDRGFGAAAAGRRLRLGGSLLLGLGPFSKLRFELPLPGWELKVDGERAAFNQSVPVRAGVVWFEMEGRLPSSYAGPLPLAIRSMERELISEGKLAAARIPLLRGTLKTMREVPRNLPPSATLRFSSPMAGRRFYDGEEASAGIYLPFLAELEGEIVPPATGMASFVFDPGYGKVWIDGKLVLDSLEPTRPAKSEPVMLTAGKAARLRFQAMVMDMPQSGRVFSLSVKAPGADAFEPLPMSWIKP